MPRRPGEGRRDPGRTRARRGGAALDRASSARAPGPSERAGRPEQLFGAWRTFFERLAATAPVVMVFEDHHYADTGLLDFIDHLLEWSRKSRIYVMTLARPELLERRPDWGAGKRNFFSMYLEPLSETAMRTLLAGLVPGPARGGRASSAERTGCRCTPSRPCGCSSPRAVWSRTASTVPSGTSHARRARDIDGAHRRAARRPGAGRAPRAGCRRARPELHHRGSRRGVRARRDGARRPAP